MPFWVELQWVRYTTTLPHFLSYKMGENEISPPSKDWHKKKVSQNIERTHYIVWYIYMVGSGFLSPLSELPLFFWDRKNFHHHPFLGFGILQWGHLGV